MEGSIRYEMDGEWMEISGGEFQHTAAGVREAVYPLGCRTLLLNVVTRSRRRFTSSFLRQSKLKRKEVELHDKLYRSS